MIKAVIFDFDMTLVNSLKQKLFLMWKFCRANNRSMIPLLLNIKKFFGMSMKQMVNEYSSYPMPEAIRIYKKAYMETEHMTRFEGKHAITELKKRGYKIGIVSNELEENIKLVLRRNKVKVNAILSTANLKKSKPDPLPLRIMMKRLKVRPSEVLYIGDHPRDIEMGRRAGVKTAGLVNILHGARELERYKPDYLIININDTMNIL